MKVCLVEGWRRAYRWGSMQLHVIGTVMASVFLMVPSMPAEIQQLLPPLWRGILIVAWFALGIFVRLVQQPAKPKQPQ